LSIPLQYDRVHNGSVVGLPVQYKKKNFIWSFDIFEIIVQTLEKYFDIFTDDKHSSEPTAIDLKSL
jgi:hypothetical protein